MNSTVISYATFALIISITLIIGYIANKFLTKLVQRSAVELTRDPTNHKFLKHVVLAGIYLSGFAIAVYSIPSLRALAGSLLAGAGIFAVAIGFAAQHALGNIVSGVFIVVFKPFRINDRLSLQAHQGVVEDITLRHTVIRNFENRRIVIPNSVISNEIIVNSDYEDDKIAKIIDVSISYESDIDTAKQLISELVKAHPLRIDPRTPNDIEMGVPEVPIRVVGLAENSVNIRSWVWAKDTSDAFVIGCDLMESIKKRIDQTDNVEVPYPHRTVIIKK